MKFTLAAPGWLLQLLILFSCSWEKGEMPSYSDWILASANSLEWGYLVGPGCSWNLCKLEQLKSILIQIHRGLQYHVHPYRLPPPTLTTIVTFLGLCPAPLTAGRGTPGMLLPFLSLSFVICKLWWGFSEIILIRHLAQGWPRRHTGSEAAGVARDGGSAEEFPTIKPWTWSLLFPYYYLPWVSSPEPHMGFCPSLVTLPSCVSQSSFDGGKGHPAWTQSIETDSLWSRKLAIYSKNHRKQFSFPHNDRSPVMSGSHFVPLQAIQGSHTFPNSLLTSQRLITGNLENVANPFKTHYV